MAASGDRCSDAAAAGEGGSDLYSVLGLNKECSNAELKVAYRKLAMRWHPDKCSSSGSVKHMEEAKVKFQEIQSAYSVLSDANKRFLYDVGVYEDEDEDHEDSLQGMGDFIGEMAQMMSKARPTRQESFEELQQLFVDMFQSDLDSGFCNGPTKSHKVQGQSRSRTSSASPLSPSPPPSATTETEVPSFGFNKQGSLAMGSEKSPGPVKTSVGNHQQYNSLCFDSQESFGELQQLFVDMFQPDLDSGFCNKPTRSHQVQGQGPSRTSPAPPSLSSYLPPPTLTETEVPLCGFNKRGSSAMDSGKPPRPVEASVGNQQCNSFCFGMTVTKKAPEMRGLNASRRNGRKQKLSSKHDVASEDDA